MSTPQSTITSATTGMDTDLLTIGGIGLGIGVTIFVLRRGWGLVRSFSK